MSVDTPRLIPHHASRRRNVTAAVGLTILGGWVLIALFGWLIRPFDPTDFISYEMYAPEKGALLGTDYMGRDLFSRLLSGTPVTLGMSFLATLVSHLLGVSAGLTAAMRGGAVDMVLSRIVDVMLSLPNIIVALMVVAALGSSVSVLILTTGFVYSASVFRIARALANDVRSLDFVRAAQARGEGTLWLSSGEILPNILKPLAADFALRLGFVLLFISSLSFLGLGVQPPLADWGALVRENMSGLSSGKLAPVYPALAIASVTIALNLLVDAWSDRSIGQGNARGAAK